MPHSPAEKKRAINRLRRIRGQAEALERAIEHGADCGAVLQQLSAIRGAVNGLMLDVMEGHLRESFGYFEAEAKQTALQAPIDDAVALFRSYLK